MTYSTQHVLFRWGGTMGATSADLTDIWSCGVRIFTGAVALTEEKKSAFLAAVQAPIITWWAATATQGHPSAWLREMSAAYIDLDGKYVGGDSQPTTKLTTGTPAAGKGGNSHPFSVSCVVTLSSDIDRGRGSRGRFYIPTGLSIDSSGRWTLVNAAGVAAAAKTLIDSINTAARAQWSPAAGVSVFSKEGTGTIGTVTKVGVGRAPDTQRRRDNKVLEERADIDLDTALAARDAIQERVYSAGE